MRGVRISPVQWAQTSEHVEATAPQRWEKDMLFTDLAASQNLQIFRYEDVDHFRQGLRDAGVDFVPLVNFKGLLGQAILALPGCNIFLLRTFPRVVHAMFARRCTFVMFSLQDGINAT